MGTAVEVYGHACSLTETNAYGWVSVCSCGWLGGVHPTSRRLGNKGRPSTVQTELAKGAAGNEHERHLRKVAAQLAADAQRALDDHGRRIDLANRTLQRRGRWGSG